jgi:putative glycosyltransferase (TIGR04348 family)
MKISLITPQGTVSRTGNQHTAQRWAGFLRGAGHRVKVAHEWAGGSADLLVALHARKSAASVEGFHRAHPDRPLIVALTGTDLYRDIETHPEAQRCLELATRLVVLQPHGRTRLGHHLHPKVRVIYQSSDTRLAPRPPKSVFRVAVVGHLREEKDPFRTVAALARLPRQPKVEVVQVGAAMSPDMAATAQGWMAAEPRYRWLRSLPHPEALRWMARSHVLVVSSLMEGGANVICEAARIGVPVLASRISGNVGMLGAGYPGYYALGDERGLARRIARAATDHDWYARLGAAILARRPLFAPEAERRGLLALVGEFAA